MKRKKNIISKSETENEREIESSFYRLIFMGDSEVGKTQIINKYTNKIYKEEYFPTYSVDFQIKAIKNNGRMLNIYCIDTEGSSDFSINTGAVFIQKADAFIYVFDITSIDSLYNLKDYNDIIKSALIGSKKMTNKKVSYVVGNKCDLVMYRQVQDNEARSEANRYNAKYMEVSAKTGFNIDKLFNYVIQDIFTNEEKSSSIDSGGGGGILDKNIYNNNNQINNTNIINQNQINTNTNTNIITNIDTNTNANIITNIEPNSNTNIINKINIPINNNINNNINTNVINPTNIDDNTENSNIHNNMNTNTNLTENEKSGLNYDNSSFYLKSNYNNNDNNNDLVKNINNIGINDNKEDVNNPNFFSNNNNNNYFKKCQIF
jgi:small GTP-binding protein